jgi:hypothetical protein
VTVALFSQNDLKASNVSTTQNAVASITYASVAGFPLGSVVDHIAVTITGSKSGNTTPVVSNVAPGTATVTFTNLIPDTYGIVVQGMPATGPGFGSPVNASITITATTMSLTLPSAVSVTQP